MIELKTREVKRHSFEGDHEEDLMKEHAKEEGYHYSLKDSCLMSNKVFEVEVALEVFMNKSVPFASVLIKVCGVPKVLVELAICKACKLSV